MRSSDPILRIKTYTWPRDSHNLFDYESETIAKDHLRVQTSIKLFRNENRIKSSPENPRSTPFLSISKSVSGFILHSDSNNEIWHVIDCKKSKSLVKGFNLAQGKLVKFGRVQYKIKEICSTYQPGPVLSFSRTASKIEGLCRLCLVEEEENDPLISPCNCGGTMKYIHLSCFRRWIECKTSKKSNENGASYHVKSLTCEISRCPIQPSIVVQEQKVDLLGIQKVEPPYITLESGVSEKNEYCLHMISMNNKKSLKLGRGHDSDIRISDISVSRCHAIIKYENEEFVLEDNNSKFGTLVEGKEVEINKGNERVCLQIGRTLLVAMMSWEEDEGCDMSIEETDEDQED